MVEAANLEHINRTFLGANSDHVVLLGLLLAFFLRVRLILAASPLVGLASCKARREVLQSNTTLDLVLGEVTNIDEQQRLDDANVRGRWLQLECLLAVLLAGWEARIKRLVFLALKTRSNKS